MQIATWNINSLNVRLPQLLDWLQANPVDAIGLQELKLTDDKFPFMELQAAGYQAVCHGQKPTTASPSSAATPCVMWCATSPAWTMSKPV